MTKNYEIICQFGTLTVLKSSDLTYLKGSKTDLSLRLDVDYSDFRGLLVDGQALDSDKYESASGSTVITLKSAYLESLKVGSYTMTVQFKNANDMKLTFYVKNAGDGDKPRTGDDARPGLYLGLAGGSLVLLGGVYFLLRKNKRK